MPFSVFSAYKNPLYFSNWFNYYYFLYCAKRLPPNPIFVPSPNHHGKKKLFLPCKTGTRKKLPYNCSPVAFSLCRSPPDRNAKSKHKEKRISNFHQTIFTDTIEITTFFANAVAIMLHRIGFLNSNYLHCRPENLQTQVNGKLVRAMFGMCGVCARI